jgi:uncharacterized membrane protein (DUF373 family)
MAELHPTRTAMQEGFRIQCSRHLSTVEISIYTLLGVLLIATALFGIAGELHLLWSGFRDWTGTTTIFDLIDRILFILMLVEILHTVRISIRSHMLVIEPFLIVGLIAIIRRMLVLTLQAENYTNPTHWGADGQVLFRDFMMEMGMLALMVAVLVASIYIIRRSQQDTGVLPE